MDRAKTLFLFLSLSLLIRTTSIQQHSQFFSQFAIFLLSIFFWWGDSIHFSLDSFILLLVVVVFFLLFIVRLSLFWSKSFQFSLFLLFFFKWNETKNYNRFFSVVWFCSFGQMVTVWTKWWCECEKWTNRENVDDENLSSCRCLNDDDDYIFFRKSILRIHIANPAMWT